MIIFFPFLVTTFCDLRNCCPFLRHETVPCFPLKALWFHILCLVLYSTPQSYLCVWCNIEVEIHFYSIWIFSYSNTICGKNFPFSIGLLWCFYQKSHKCGVLFPLIYLPMLMSVPHCLDYCGLIISLEIR